MAAPSRSASTGGASPPSDSWLPRTKAPRRGRRAGGWRGSNPGALAARSGGPYLTGLPFARRSRAPPARGGPCAYSCLAGPASLRPVLAPWRRPRRRPPDPARRSLRSPPRRADPTFSLIHYAPAGDRRRRPARGAAPPPPQGRLPARTSANPGPARPSTPQALPGWFCASSKRRYAPAFGFRGRVAELAGAERGQQVGRRASTSTCRRPRREPGVGPPPACPASDRPGGVLIGRPPSECGLLLSGRVRDLPQAPSSGRFRRRSWRAYLPESVDDILDVTGTETPRVGKARAAPNERHGNSPRHRYGMAGISALRLARGHPPRRRAALRPGGAPRGAP